MVEDSIGTKDECIKVRRKVSDVRYEGVTFGAFFVVKICK